MSIVLHCYCYEIWPGQRDDLGSLEHYNTGSLFMSGRIYFCQVTSTACECYHQSKHFVYFTNTIRVLEHYSDCHFSQKNGIPYELL